VSLTIPTMRRCSLAVFRMRNCAFSTFATSPIRKRSLTGRQGPCGRGSFPHQGAGHRASIEPWIRSLIGCAGSTGTAMARAMGMATQPSCSSGPSVMATAFKFCVLRTISKRTTKIYSKRQVSKGSRVLIDQRLAIKLARRESAEPVFIDGRESARHPLVTGVPTFHWHSTQARASRWISGRPACCDDDANETSPCLRRLGSGRCGGFPIVLTGRGGPYSRRLPRPHRFAACKSGAPTRRTAFPAAHRCGSKMPCPPWARLSIGIRGQQRCRNFLAE